MEIASTKLETQRPLATILDGRGQVPLVGSQYGARGTQVPKSAKLPKYGAKYCNAKPRRSNAASTITNRRQECHTFIK